MIVARIIALLIGYGFGLFQTGYLYGKSKELISVSREAEMQARQILCGCLDGKPALLHLPVIF